MNRAQKVLKLATVTGELLSRAQRRQQEKTASTNAVAALIPQVVESLVKNERIHAHQTAKVAEALSNPAQVLELLRDTAKHRNASELTIGRPQEPKVAATRNTAPGAIVDFDETVAGQAFANPILNRR